MYNSIQHFVKYGIPQLEETQKTLSLFKMAVAVNSIV